MSLTGNEATTTSPDSAGPSLTSGAQNDKTRCDLIVGSFAVIESCLAVFTTLVHALAQAVEPYEIEPWAHDYLHPTNGLLFRLLWRKDSGTLPKKKMSGLQDGEEDLMKLWFANRLSDDACSW